MKNSIKLFIVIIFISFFTDAVKSQNIYTYYVHLNDYKIAPEFVEIGNEMIYRGKDKSMSTFF